jgi:sulfite reductase alpha subunit
MRVNQPAGWFYTSDALRTLADIWERHGSSLTNMHGSTGDIILLGTRSEELEPAFKELTDAGFDLGGSGSAMRTPSACVGPARCEWACYDTLAVCYNLTITYQDELHRPAFPYKFKIKCSGCPNDCVASIARADLSIIGIWKDDIRQDEGAVAQYAATGLDIQQEVCAHCPTKAMAWDGARLTIENRECVRCMHCINVMPKALRPGVETGATLLIGGKAPIVQGALLSSVLVPFVPAAELEETLKELIKRLWEFWDEYGRSRERIGELIQRVGMANFLDAIGLDPVPEMVSAPRDNPYVFFKKE